MRTIGIKALKNDLSKHIRAAASGETVRVTDRGKVVAEIVPPFAAGATHAEREMAAMIREGIVRPARRKLTGPPPSLPAIMTMEEMLRDLDESRSDR